MKQEQENILKSHKAPKQSNHLQLKETAALKKKGAGENGWRLRQMQENLRGCWARDGNLAHMWKVRQDSNLEMVDTSGNIRRPYKIPIFAEF